MIGLSEYLDKPFWEYAAFKASINSKNVRGNWKSGRRTIIPFYDLWKF